MTDQNAPGQGSRLFPRIVWLFGLLAAPLLGLAAVPVMIGPERVAEVAGTWLSGYDVMVRGGAVVEFKADFTAPILIRAEDIVLRLPDNRFTPVESPPVARIARFEATVNPWPLFMGGIGFKRIEFVRPGIRLDKNANGFTNWSSADKPTLGNQKMIQIGAWRDASVETLTISGGTLRYTDHRLERDLSFDNLNIEAGISTAPDGLAFRLRGDASHRGEPVYGEMELRRLGDFHAGTRVPFAMTFDAAPGQLHIRGTVAERNRRAFTSTLELDIDDPDSLVRMLPLVPTELAEPTSLRAHIEVNGGRVVGKIRSLILGKTDVSGRLSVDFDERLPQLEVALDAGAIDIMHLKSAVTYSGLVDAKDLSNRRRFHLGGGAGLKWTRVILPRGEIGPGAAGLSWRTGEPNLAIDLPNLPLFGGAFSGRAEITANEGKTAVSLSVTGSDIGAAGLLKSLADNQGVDGRLHGNADILAVGGSVDELMAAVSGGGRMSLTEGKVFGSQLQLAVDRGQRSLDLGRASMDFVIEGGVLKSEELLMDFDVGHARARFEWDTLEDKATVTFKPSPIHEGADGPVSISGRLSDLLAAR